MPTVCSQNCISSIYHYSLISLSEVAFLVLSSKVGSRGGSRDIFTLGQVVSSYAPVHNPGTACTRNCTLSCACNSSLHIFLHLLSFVCLQIGMCCLTSSRYKQKSRFLVLVYHIQLDSCSQKCRRQIVAYSSHFFNGITEKAQLDVTNYSTSYTVTGIKENLHGHFKVAICH